MGGQRPSPNISRNTGGAFCSADSFIQLIPGHRKTASSQWPSESLVPRLQKWELATVINRVWLRRALSPAVELPSQALCLVVTFAHCSYKEGAGVHRGRSAPLVTGP